MKEVKKFTKSTVMEHPWLQNEEFCSSLNEFAEMRRRIKKPLLESARCTALLTLIRLAGDDIETAIAILDESTFHCWQGLFPLKVV